MEARMDLYQAILARHSIRRYARRPLDRDALARVHGILAEIKPLAPDNQIHILVRDATGDEDLTQTLGAYGHIVSAPHYLVPYLVGETHPLTDLGYRVEQIAVRLAGLGIGSCYIGTLRQEDRLRQRFSLPAAARIGALLVFGYPTTHPGGRAFDAVVHLAVGATRKYPPERIFYRETFARPAMPPDELIPLVEATRSAPSAVNAQPWRLLWHNGTLYLFVQRENPRYGSGATADYRLYDGGICMGNVALALEALGRPDRWQLLSDTDQDLPAHPPELQPLAKLS